MVYKHLHSNSSNNTLASEVMFLNFDFGKAFSPDNPLPEIGV